MNILSLFDGISCCRVALERANIQVDKYYASEIDKYAIQVAQHNYPNTIQLGDINNWRNWNIDWASIDLVAGGSPCFPAGSLVLREDGFVPIENVKVGDLVVTHKGRLRKVLNVGAKISNTVMVKGQGTNGIECTANHKFYCTEKVKKWDNNLHKYIYHHTEPKWVEAKDICDKFWFNVFPSDKIEIPKPAESCKGKNGFGYIENFQMGKDFFYFIGRWLGDGWVNSHQRRNRIDSKMKRVYVCSSFNEADELEKILSRTGLHFGRNNTKTTVRFTCSSTQLYDWLTSNFGIYSNGKNIPVWCYCMPKNYRNALFRGYIDADGCLKKGNIRATSINKKLIIGMKILAGLEHRTASISLNKIPKTKIIEGRLVNQSSFFTTDFYNKSKMAIFDKNGWFGKVRSVEHCRESVMVYNLEVEEDNSYTIDGIAVHNCQGFSNAGKGLNFDDPRSALFFVFVDILNHIRNVNPNVKFLLENVKMKKEWENVITKYLCVEPVEINSSLLSAQNRARMYWTNIANIPQPTDKNIYLQDILENIQQEELVGKFKNCVRKNVLEQLDSVLKSDKIIHQLECSSGWQDNKVGIIKSPTLRAGNSFCLAKTSDNKIRTITPIEAERLQTLPDNYTAVIPNCHRYKALGNGWTVDVIAHIFSFLKK